MTDEEVIAKYEELAAADDGDAITKMLTELSSLERFPIVAQIVQREEEETERTYDFDTLCSFLPPYRPAAAAIASSSRLLA